MRNIINVNLIFTICFACSCNRNMDKNMNIYIKDPIYNKTIFCNLNKNSTIKDLKNIIYDKTGIDPKNLVLYFNKNKIINDKLKYSKYNSIYLRCKLKLGGGLIDGPCPGKHARKRKKIHSDPKKNLKPGLNVEIFCKKCRKFSNHGWGYQGVNLDKDTGFSGHNIMSRSKCQYCYTSIENSDDSNGDEQVEIISISFYKCNFDFHGTVSSYSTSSSSFLFWTTKISKIQRTKKVQTEVTHVTSDDCVTYYSNEFLKWTSMKIRVSPSLFSFMYPFIWLK